MIHLKSILGFVSIILISVMILVETDIPVLSQFASESALNGQLADVPSLLTATASPQGLVWQAQLVDIVPQVIVGGGAILRVFVEDWPGAQILVEQPGAILSDVAGAKEEYGPFAAEFAPLPSGEWVISVPEINKSITIYTDDRSLFIVKFSRVPVAEATAVAQVTPTPTPIGGAQWEGRIVNVVEGPSIAGAILRVRIKGTTGIPVDIRTVTDFIGQGITGFKPELDPDVAEFAGLSEGQYVIVPHGLSTRMNIDLQKNTTVFVEFSPNIPPTATATPTLPSPTATPRPRPSATPTSTPTLTPTPLKKWVLSVTDRTKINQSSPRLLIQVEDQSDVDISISKENSAFKTTCTTGSQRRLAADECEVIGVSAGTYRIVWDDQNLSIPIWLNLNELTTLAFTQDILPSPDTTWQAELGENTTEPIRTDKTNSVIKVVIPERAGYIVALSRPGDNTQFCETNASGVCHFDLLSGGIYNIAPLSLAGDYQVFVDGKGLVEVIFSQETILTPTPQARGRSGFGAVPKESGTGIGAIAATPTSTSTPTLMPTPRPTATFTPVPGPTSIPTRIPNRIPTVAPTQPPTLPPPPPPPTWTPTVTVTPAPSVSPTPEFVWVGRVEQYLDHPGQTLVVRAPLDNHPLVIESGTWHIETTTGLKPEHGDFATEFAGLSPGEYVVNLVGVAQTKVVIESEKFVLLQFHYEGIPTPTPTAQPWQGEWVGAILSNTSTDEPGSGVWSILTLQVGNWNNMPIVIHTDGFETSCLTGTKPEFGDGICQVGGLWPGTYSIRPEGLPVSVDVTLDGRGAAHVAFWME